MIRQVDLFAVLDILCLLLFSPFMIVVTGKAFYVIVRQFALSAYSTKQYWIFRIMPRNNSIAGYDITFNHHFCNAQKDCRYQDLLFLLTLMMLIDAIVIFAFSFWCAISINIVGRDLPRPSAFTLNVPERRPKIRL